MLGAKVHVRLLPRNKPLNSVEPMPMVLVKLILGKNAARAAPILALACFKACSAARISGRLSKTSELKPAGSLLTLNCLLKAKPLGKSVGMG